MYGQKVISKMWNCSLKVFSVTVISVVRTKYLKYELQILHNKTYLFRRHVIEAVYSRLNPHKDNDGVSLHLFPKYLK